MDCIFCKIINGESAANIIYQDKLVIALDDLYPKAPQHKLIIPRKHIETTNDITQEDQNLVGHMIIVARNLAEKVNINKSGYRLVFNCNKDGGQIIYHVHLHLLGGRQLSFV